MGTQHIIGWEKGVAASATIVVGTEASNVINVTIQLKDYIGTDLAVANSVIAYCSSTATGLDRVTTTVSTETAIGTDGSLGILLAKSMYLLISEADGDIDLNFTDTGTNSFYLVIVLPNGNISVSSVITFA